MKSLILKDVFNILHNTKSMLFILGFFILIFIPSSGPESYLFVAAFLCSTMIVTTFSFDHYCHWTRYALIMPVTKKDIVMAKFMVLAIFCTVGSLFGCVVGIIGAFILNKAAFILSNIGELLLLTLGAWSLSFIFGSISIPLILKFDMEKARLLMVVSFLIPGLICFGIFQLITALGVIFTDFLIAAILLCSPIIALLWGTLMYLVSYRIFLKSEC